jgi:hypothetical protein
LATPESTLAPLTLISDTGKTVETAACTAITLDGCSDVTMT